jgi:hypothetical protein
MLAKDHAILEVEIANVEPSRLLIEIALRQPPVSAAPAYDEGEIQERSATGSASFLRRSNFSGWGMRRTVPRGSDDGLGGSSLSSSAPRSGAR